MAELGQQLGEIGVQQHAGGAQPDLSHRGGADIGHALKEVLVLHQEFQGPLIEDAPGVGEPEALAGALNELDVQLLLQLLDGAGQHGLGDEELGRRPGIALVADHLYKVSQMLDLQSSRPPSSRYLVSIIPENGRERQKKPSKICPTDLRDIHKTMPILYRPMPEQG